MILITGASGGVGSAVLSEMKKTGQNFRALYRKPDEAGKAPSGVEAVIGDFADKDSLKRALAGVDHLFLVCSPIPALVDLESNVIETAVESGVKHVVLNSALGAADYPKSFPSWHRQVEERLNASGLAYTILRPNGFMQNILAYMAPSIRAQGAFYSAMGPARVSYLDLRDIAAAAVKILVNSGGHEGKIYELNGPEAVSSAELAERISIAAGRAVQYVEIPEDAQSKAMLDLGMPEWQVKALMDLQRYYIEGGGGDVTDVLAKLLGREPVRLGAFLAEFKDEFQSQAAAENGGRP